MDEIGKSLPYVAFWIFMACAVFGKPFVEIHYDYNPTTNEVQK